MQFSFCRNKNRFKPFELIEVRDYETLGYGNFRRPHGKLLEIEFNAFDIWLLGSDYSNNNNPRSGIVVYFRITLKLG